MRLSAVVHPDIMVVCGPSIFDTKDKNALTNPTLIIEVLSKSTQVYDRGEKFCHYKKLDSLQTYVLISQSQILVERYTRNDGEWLVTQLHSLHDTLDLPAIGCQVTLRDIYEDVDFTAVEQD